MPVTVSLFEEEIEEVITKWIVGMHHHTERNESNNTILLSEIYQQVAQQPWINESIFIGLLDKIIISLDMHGSDMKCNNIFKSWLEIMRREVFTVIRTYLLSP